MATPGRSIIVVTFPTHPYDNPESPPRYHIPRSIFQRRAWPGHSRRRIRRGVEDQGEQDQEAGCPRPERSTATDRVRPQSAPRLLVLVDLLERPDDDLLQVLETLEHGDTLQVSLQDPGAEDDPRRTRPGRTHHPQETQVS